MDSERVAKLTARGTSPEEHARYVYEALGDSFAYAPRMGWLQKTDDGWDPVHARWNVRQAVEGVLGERRRAFGELARSFRYVDDLVRIAERAKQCAPNGSRVDFVMRAYGKMVRISTKEFKWRVRIKLTEKNLRNNRAIVREYTEMIEKNGPNEYRSMLIRDHEGRIAELEKMAEEIHALRPEERELAMIPEDERTEQQAERLEKIRKRLSKLGG